MQTSQSGITHNKGFGNWQICVAAASQIATVVITWPLWQVRSDPPHLPVLSLSLPQINFGWMMIASCLLCLLRPWFGVWVHLAVMIAACLFDEMRTQPQFAAIWVLMLAAVNAKLAPIARWFLVAMWLWAGAHKLISPDWLSHTSSDLLARISPELTEWHWPFSIGIALAEITAGVVAIGSPKKAAYLCVLMHVGIILFLSPLALNWNYSVFPWNLASAILGYNVLRNSKESLPSPNWEKMVAVVLLVYPAGFYFGWVDHGIAFVLYSEHTPQGLITSKDGVKRIRGWDTINVPFPNERRLLKRYFEAVAEPGDKLHIREPRNWLDDQYFVLIEKGKAELITEREFRSTRPFQPNFNLVKGILLDDYVAVWKLGRSGANMLKRSELSMIYAVQIPPDSYEPEQIDLVKRIPNLEQLQLAGTDITDGVLAKLADSPCLEGIGLSSTRITNQSIPTLRSMKQLLHIEFDGSELDPKLIGELLNSRNETTSTR